MTTTTRQRKAERDLARKRQQQIMLLVGIVVLAVVGLLVGILSTQAPTQAPVISADGESAYTSLTPGTSAEGMPQLGAANAPMTIYDYSSFGCSHCMNFHNEQFQQLKTDITAGDVRFVYVPVSNAFSLTASGAGFCAEEQGRFGYARHPVRLQAQIRQHGLRRIAPVRRGARAEPEQTDFRSCMSSTRTRPGSTPQPVVLYSGGSV
jgi:hypothetical protein